MPPNFVLLDATLPDVARLVTAMVQARDAVERRSWSHPQEPTSNEWWADVPGRSGGAPRSDKYHKPKTHRSPLRHHWYLVLVLLVTVVQKNSD